jgi:hypothetical protein
MSYYRDQLLEMRKMLVEQLLDAAGAVLHMRMGVAPSYTEEEAERTDRNLIEAHQLLMAIDAVIAEVAAWDEAAAA